MKHRKELYLSEAAIKRAEEMAKAANASVSRVVEMAIAGHYAYIVAMGKNTRITLK